MREVLLEVYDRGDGFPANLFLRGAHSASHVDLHTELDHHLKVEHAIAKNYLQTLFEDRILNSLVLVNVAQYEK